MCGLKPTLPHDDARRDLVLPYFAQIVKLRPLARSVAGMRLSHYGW